MSRVKIGVGAFVVLAALTATAYLLTSQSLERRIRKDLEARVSRAEQLLIQNDKLAGHDLMKKAEAFARHPTFAESVGMANVVDRAGAAGQGFVDILKGLGDGPKPDLLALVNAKGELAALEGFPRPDTEDWKSQYPAVGAALANRQVVKDVWKFRNGVFRVGVAPIADAVSGEPRGAFVIGYAVNAKEALAQSSLLGMDVAYFHGDLVAATSFRGRGGAEGDVKLLAPLFEKGLAKEALEKGQSERIRRVTIGGEEYLVSAALHADLNFADKTSGAIVLSSLTKALEPTAPVKLAILVLGFGALLVAGLAIALTARSVLGQAEEIEAGVTEIINGNVDYVFRPVGADMDGLANGLNVMLARILGRPEPGEDGGDESSLSSRAVHLDEDGVTGAAALGGTAATDPAMLALAGEPELEYYRRTFDEFVGARRAGGENVDGVTYEEFVAKLRLNEAKLKQQYGCRAVRFRVTTKNGQVTLKPVPIV